MDFIALGFVKGAELKATFTQYCCSEEVVELGLLPVKITAGDTLDEEILRSIYQVNIDDGQQLFLGIDKKTATHATLADVYNFGKGRSIEQHYLVADRQAFVLTSFNQ